MDMNLLSAVRITRVLEMLQDVRNRPAELVWLGRTTSVQAEDSEIMVRVMGLTQIADIITDDAAAVTYTTGKMTSYTHTVPNLKHGIQLTQTQIRQLTNLRQGVGDLKAYTNSEMAMVDRLLLGIRQRKEALLVAMLLDGLNYDRLGVKINATWGVPADLKVTPSTAWDSTSATPVADVLNLKRNAQIRYGIVLDRLTMSRAAFDYMIATTEFQNKTRMLLAPNVSYTNLSLQNTDQMRTLAQNVMGVDIEFYDSRYWQQAPDGSYSSAPFLPIYKVIFSSKANDNNPTQWDWATGITTESQIGGIVGGNMARIGSGNYGPIAYATVPPDLNPPNITYWAVERGFPRKHNIWANAVLTVGSFTDPVSLAVPF
jgi:hypothetical protein